MVDIRDEFNYLLQQGRARVPRTYEVTPFVPKPTDLDFEIGWIERYFCKKTNDKDAFVIEISKDTYNILQDISYYMTVSLRWMIRGPLQTKYKEDGTVKVKGIIEVNRKLIRIAEQEMPGLELRLPNLDQFYRGE